MGGEFALMLLNLDTHIFLHAVQGKLRVSEEILLARHDWSIAAIVIWEIAMLANRNRIAVDLESPTLLAELERTRIWPIAPTVCRQLSRLDFRSDPADELLAATSLAHRLPLVTRDRVVLSSTIVPFALDAEEE